MGNKMTESGKKIFAERLRYVRKDLREISQAQLAEKAEISCVTISRFESATDTRRPSFDNLRQLALALHISIDYLSGLSDEPFKHLDPILLKVSYMSEKKRTFIASIINNLAAQEE